MITADCVCMRDCRKQINHQGSFRFCAPYSIANALHYAGFHQDSEKIAHAAHIICYGAPTSRKAPAPAEKVQKTHQHDPWVELGKFIDRNLKLWQVKYEHFAPGELREVCMAGYDFPVVLNLMDHKMNTEHCVSIFQNMIFDSTYEHAMLLSTTTLMRCCHPHRYQGVCRMAQLVPCNAQLDTVKKIMSKAGCGASQGCALLK